jgi:hypothetical protein
MGLTFGQLACTSQTAIAIRTVDGSTQTDLVAAADRAASESSPDHLPGPEPGPEAGSDLPTSLDAQTSSPLFYDGFDGTYGVNWMTSGSGDGPVTDAMDGSNMIVTLDSTQSDFSRLRCNLTGDHFKEVNLTASMRIRIEQAPTSTRTVRLDVRQAATTENIFYAVGVTVATDGTMTKVSLFKKVADGAGNYTICELAAGAPFATPVPMNQWRTIKLTITGTTNVRLKAYFEEQTTPMATYTDDCVSPLIATNGATVDNGGCLADQWGLGIQVEKGIKASADDVLVTTP